MPASYAHYRFGKQLLPQLPGEVRQCIGRFRRMYDMGLNGPDILYYYNPLVKNAVSDLCGSYHAMSGQDLFSAACEHAGSEAGKAYLYGLLAHYCLDAACRPYVLQAAAAGERPAQVLDAEFDRYLLTLDQKEPAHSYDLSPKLKLTRGECMTVAEFYPPAAGAHISASIRNFRLGWKLSAGKNRSRQESLLKKVKPELCGLLIPKEPVPGLERINSELLARYNRAARQYPQMLDQLLTYMRTGEPLGQDFAGKFG